MKRAVLTLWNALIGLFLLMVVVYSCSKGGDDPPIDPCASVSITVTGTVTDTDAGLSTGSIAATASGSTGFTFSLNNGAFQGSGTFSNLAKGTYTVTAKDGKGCSKSSAFTIADKAGCTGQAGPLFVAVKAVLQTNCAISGCHSGPNPQNGINFTLDCTIVFLKDRIKVRAVDNAGTPAQMPPPPNPPLSVADRDKITAWITAGGAFVN